MLSVPHQTSAIVSGYLPLFSTFCLSNRWSTTILVLFMAAVVGIACRSRLKSMYVLPSVEKNLWVMDWITTRAKSSIAYLKGKLQAAQLIVCHKQLQALSLECKQVPQLLSVCPDELGLGLHLLFVVLSTKAMMAPPDGPRQPVCWTVIIYHPLGGQGKLCSPVWPQPRWHLVAHQPHADRMAAVVILFP
uniref:GUN5 n=1 Tax=Arundo donax TaxID=35708 RepID=A0A0A9HAR8_ARUDO